MHIYETYLPLVTPRSNSSGRQAISFASTPMSQNLPVLHYAALSFFRIKGHFLDGKILIFILRLSLLLRERGQNICGKCNSAAFSHETKHKHHYLELHFLFFLLYLNCMFGLGYRGLPHAVRQKWEQSFNNLRHWDTIQIILIPTWGQQQHYIVLLCFVGINIKIVSVLRLTNNYTEPHLIWILKAMKHLEV